MACPAPRLLRTLLLGAMGGALLLAGCGRQESASAGAAPAAGAGEQRLPDGTVVIPADSPKLQEIRVAPVRTADTPFDEVVAPGKIETNPNLVAHVTLPIPGRVSAVLVKLGDAVERGQPVATLDSPDADAAISTYLQAQAGVTQAKANLNKAQTDSDRATDLFQHNAVAQKDALTADNALAQAKAALEQAQAALEQADRRLKMLGLQPGSFGQKVTVAAPISGKVLEMNVAAGEYHNDANAPLMTIADLSTVWVASDVPESDIRLIDPGERIDVTLAAYPGETFHGRVTRIADTVDPQTRTVTVRAEMDNSRGRLRPQMFGTIRHTESMRVVPVVPVGAVLQGGGKSVVWVERAPGRFQPVEVKTGERHGDAFPVLAGIREGDRVVVDGAMLLRAQ
ncbi:MAG: efflux RND transporter periplasmic adaptor subunit [Bryobacteraceae bacterium]|jgi:cobalt-zinc-cadmium efflux system membrane fusion protein